MIALSVGKVMSIPAAPDQGRCSDGFLPAACVLGQGHSYGRSPGRSKRVRAWSGEYLKTKLDEVFKRVAEGGRKVKPSLAKR